MNFDSSQVFGDKFPFLVISLTAITNPYCSQQQTMSSIIQFVENNGRYNTNHGQSNTYIANTKETRANTARAIVNATQAMVNTVKGIAL
ncbi:13642_t:CDS:2 [Entrophospora sp. SA101]|nr:13642_t:CDS:2 [Entrophospora sp. SA101]